MIEQTDGGSGRPAGPPGPPRDPHTDSNEPAPLNWSIAAALLNWGKMAAYVNGVNLRTVITSGHFRLPLPGRLHLSTGSINITATVF